MTCASICINNAAPSASRPSSRNCAPKRTSRSTISSKPRIAITLGDPAGIGPEVVRKALRDPRVSRACIPMVIGKRSRVPMGRSSRLAGRLAIDALDQGLRMVQQGAAEALVTAPVSKESFRLADHGFPGHTEWLAERCQAPDAAMLMVSGPLRAILMTRHVPLTQVSRVLTKRVLIRAAEMGYAFVKTCVLPHPDRSNDRPLPKGEGRAKHRVRLPRLILCGLNPHAGDHGIIGTEEERVFRPALQVLKRQGIPVTGPLPADSVFPMMAQERFDLALATYHDQGMIPLKLYAPYQVVNVTLGLPFVRTSPGHGTAYDIAGKGKAHPGPMIEAILLAARYCR